MKGFRVTISGLIGVVAGSAICLAGMLRPTQIGSSLIFTAMAAMLLGAALVSWVGGTRSFWFGFAVFGLGYHFLALVANSDMGYSISPDDYISRHLFPVIHPDIYKRYPKTPFPPGVTEFAATSSWEESESYVSFRRDVRCGYSLLFALAGGLFARVLHDRRKQLA